MDFKSIFRKKKKTYADYTTSDHAAVYEKIANNLNTSPQHVYEIAHGKGVKTYDDRVIWSELIMENIISF